MNCKTLTVSNVPLDFHIHCNCSHRTLYFLGLCSLFFPSFLFSFWIILYCAYVFIMKMLCLMWTLPIQMLFVRVFFSVCLLVSRNFFFFKFKTFFSFCFCKFGFYEWDFVFSLSGFLFISLSVMATAKLSHFLNECVYKYTLKCRPSIVTLSIQRS